MTSAAWIMYPGYVACCKYQKQGSWVKITTTFQHFWLHIFSCNQKKPKTSFFISAMLDNGPVLYTVPAPKTISYSLPSPNTDGTITRAHTRDPIKSCSLLHCTQCKFSPQWLSSSCTEEHYKQCGCSQSEGALTPLQQWADLSSLPQHTQREDLLPGRCGGSYCK